MDIQGRGQREYQSEGGRSLPKYNWLRMSLNIGILKINSILTYLEFKVNSFFQNSEQKNPKDKNHQILGIKTFALFF